MSNKATIEITISPAIGVERIWTKEGFRDDPWRMLDDNAPWPKEGSFVVPISRWRAEHHALVAAEKLNIGLALAVADDFDPASDELDRVQLIVLPFPKFTDGRAYSTARRLREQWGYRGELRASGDVLFDQLPLMLRCGFDSFSIADASTLARLEREGLRMPTRMYQSFTCSSVAERPAIASKGEHALTAAE